MTINHFIKNKKENFETKILHYRKVIFFEIILKEKRIT